MFSRMIICMKIVIFNKSKGLESFNMNRICFWMEFFLDFDHSSAVGRIKQYRSQIRCSPCTSRSEANSDSIEILVTLCCVELSP